MRTGGIPRIILETSFLALLKKSHLTKNGPMTQAWN